MADVGDLHTRAGLEKSLVESLYTAPTTSTSPSGTEDTSMKPAEKTLIEKNVEAVLASLPNPWVQQILLQQAPRTLDLLGSISRSDSLGQSDKSTIMAAIVTAQLAKTDQGSGTQVSADALSNALKTYTSLSAGAPAGNLLETHMLLANNPLLLSSLSLDKLSAPLVLMAFRKAEQELVLSMLQKWQENIQQIEKRMSEEERQKFLAGKTQPQLMLEAYCSAVASGKIPLSPPAVSALLLGISLGTEGQPNRALSLITSLTLPLIHGDAGLVPSNVAYTLEILQRQAGFLALPGALSRMNGGEAPSEALVRSFGILVAQKLFSADFENLIKSVLQDKIPEENIDAYLASLRTYVFVNALIALDKTEQGSTTATDLKGLLNGTVTLQHEDVRTSLVTLINVELQKIPEKERQSILNGLYAYIDTNPDVSDLIDSASSLITAVKESFSLSIEKQAAQGV